MDDKTINQAMAKVKNGSLSRTELLRMRTYAERHVRDNPRIADLVELINKTTVPSLEAGYIFMGYCPGGDILRRIDKEWLKEGIITFEFVESERQKKVFEEIRAPDKIILKKREIFGKTMIIHAYGEVTASSRCNSSGLIYHSVDWKIKNRRIEVPLLGCNATVNKRSLAKVEQGMPTDFWDWLRNAS